ncbi:MAG TPA: TIGR01212 family radical SAM protein [Clostridiales bacterium]|nr:TIGR01212 family radical SAM protein [Clostridiales bacterium]
MHICLKTHNKRSKILNNDNLNLPYYGFSEYLKQRYGERTYKLPVNLPAGCPNRDGRVATGGCIFCGEEGAGFELLPSFLPVREQLLKNKEYIGKKYNVQKFIAYFQNYSNTYFPYKVFCEYISQAIIPDVVAIYISTRPDCIYPEHMQFLKDMKEKTGVDITLEIGLQSINNETLKFLNRGHTVEDFFQAVERVKGYGLDVCAHVIQDLPMDTVEDIACCADQLSSAGVHQVKCHSLYILDGTVLGDLYQQGRFQVLPLEDFIKRTGVFLSHLDPSVVVQRLISRAPKERTLYCNHSTGWWKVHDMILEYMTKEGLSQGCSYQKP